MKTGTLVLLLFAICVSAHAQTCTGSLGDPIIKYTFGTSATNPGPPLSAGITDLQYDATTCPGDGYYTIASYSTNCFGAWITLTDHTGDVNGDYMLVNASIQPSVFYVDTIDNLCGNVTYQFGAWVINMVSSPGYIEPNLTFAIHSPSGTLLQSNNTGNIPLTGTQWNYYSFNFTTAPGTTSVILSITNNAPGGGGNDLAIDDISLRPVGPQIDVAIQGYSTDTISFCTAVPALNFIARVDSCFPVTVYQWQFSGDSGITWVDIAGATALNYTPSISSVGAYIYRMAAASVGNINNTQCRVLSSLIAIYHNPGPSISLTPVDTTVCPGSTVVFTASGADIYQWSDLIQGPKDTVTVTSSSFYTVKASDSGSVCISIDTVYTNVFMPVIPVITQQTAGPCGNDTVFLSATGGATYLWSNGAVSSTISIHPVPDTTFTVTATDVNGCTATASSVTIASAAWSIVSTISNPPCPAINTGSIDLSASGDTAQLHYLWNTGLNFTHLDSLAPGTYSVDVSDNTGCQTSFTFTLAYSYTLQAIIAPGDTSLPLGATCTLQVTSNTNNANHYLWYPSAGLSCTDCTAPVDSVNNNSSTYTVNVVDQNGCEATASVHIRGVDTPEVTIYINPYIYIPNAFTPTGDGNNDFFQIFGTGAALDSIRIFSVKIFDRWGELVYESLDPAFKWNGTYKGNRLPPGVYVYLINYVWAGSSAAQHNKGSLILIR